MIRWKVDTGSMRRGVLLVAAAAVLAAALAGVATAADTRVVRVPAVGLRFSIPAAWQSVDPRLAASEAGKALRKENPQLAGLIGEIDRPGSPVKLVAFDKKPIDGFTTNVNVVVTDVPRSATFDQYLAATRSELGQLPGIVRPPTVRSLQLPGGRAVRTQLRLGVKVNGRQVVAEISQFAFLRDGKSIVISFTAVASAAARLAPTFNRAGRSIRFA